MIVNLDVLPGFSRVFYAIHSWSYVLCLGHVQRGVSFACPPCRAWFLVFQSQDDRFFGEFRGIIRPIRGYFPPFILGHVLCSRHDQQNVVLRVTLAGRGFGHFGVSCPSDDRGVVRVPNTHTLALGILGVNLV